MRTTLVAEPVRDVGADARVRDYDELDAGDATAFHASLEERRSRPSPLEDGDVVKYTGYYRVRVET